MKIKVSEATGKALGYLIAKCEGVNLAPLDWYGDYLSVFGSDEAFYAPYEIWSQGGPIGEREHLQACYQTGGIHKGGWGCIKWNEGHRGFVQQYGATLLIAAMRCYVASKLGDTPEVPDGLA